MSEVKVFNSNIEAAIAKFKKSTTGLMKELRLRGAFESKPERRRRKAKEGKRRRAKMLRRMEQAKFNYYKSK
jgi:small subunit ribosomal protein S21